MPDSKPPASQDNDREAFLEAMGDVDRLEQDRAEPFHRRRRPVPIDQPEERSAQEVYADRSLETGDELQFMRPGLQRRVYQDLRRGRITPEASLDLHGLRVEEARRVLYQFIMHALDRRFRCVRIVHGKGGRAGDRQPILKQKVDQWLPQQREVLALCSAPSWDGGTGAAYVLLARRREGQDDSKE
jgi:DNA-nicking Smr family endonuclease